MNDKIEDNFKLKTVGQVLAEDLDGSSMNNFVNHPDYTVLEDDAKDDNFSRISTTFLQKIYFKIISQWIQSSENKVF